MTEDEFIDMLQEYYYNPERQYEYLPEWGKFPLNDLNKEQDFLYNENLRADS